MLSLKLFGIKTPQFRVLPRDASEFAQIQRGVFALYSAQGFDPPSGVAQLFDAPALVVTELVRSVDVRSWGRFVRRPDPPTHPLNPAAIRCATSRRDSERW